LESNDYKVSSSQVKEKKGLILSASHQPDFDITTSILGCPDRSGSRNSTELREWYNKTHHLTFGTGQMKTDLFQLLDNGATDYLRPRPFRTGEWNWAEFVQQIRKKPKIPENNSIITCGDIEI